MHSLAPAQKPHLRAARPSSAEKQANLVAGPRDNAFGSGGETAVLQAHPVFTQGLLQPKLTIGASNDPLEQEADRVAKHVMGMAEPHAQRADVSGPAPAAVRLRAASAHCGSITAPPIVHEVLNSPGAPLDGAARTFLEPRFGYDFGGVRVHTDAKAAESAAVIGARAYTAGSRIAFGFGEYAPSSRAGLEVLSHELSHVVQQSADAHTIRRLPLDDTDAESQEPQSAIDMLVARVTSLFAGMNLLEDNAIASVAEEIIDIFDNIRVILFSDAGDPRFIEASLVAFIWEICKKPLTTSGVTTKITDNTHKDTLVQTVLAEERAANGDTSQEEQDAETDSSKGEKKQPVEKDASGRSRIAAWMKDFLDGTLFPFLKSRPVALELIRAAVQKHAASSYIRLQLLGITNASTGQPDAKEPFDPEKTTWYDLSEIWFYELGNAKIGSTQKHPLTFGPNAWTTRQLRINPAMKDILELGRARAKNIAGVIPPRRAPDNKIKADVHYGNAEFKASLSTRDITMMFIGSFEVDINIKSDEGLMEVSATNPSGWESATRFIKGGKPIIENKDRGEGPVPIGGTLYCEWQWTEPLNPVWAGWVPDSEKKSDPIILPRVTLIPSNAVRTRWTTVAADKASVKPVLVPDGPYSGAVEKLDNALGPSIQVSASLAEFSTLDTAIRYARDINKETITLLQNNKPPDMLTSPDYDWKARQDDAEKAQQILKDKFGDFWGTFFWWTRGGGQTGQGSPVWDVLNGFDGINRAGEIPSDRRVYPTESPK